jgi:hypothetical protein
VCTPNEQPSDITDARVAVRLVGRTDIVCNEYIGLCCCRLPAPVVQDSHNPVTEWAPCISNDS